MNNIGGGTKRVKAGLIAQVKVRQADNPQPNRALGVVCGRYLPAARRAGDRSNSAHLRQDFVASSSTRRATQEVR